MSNSAPAPENTSLKALIIKGLVGGIALAGTTAIPIVVQRSLDTPPVLPAGAESTVPVTPAQVAPLPNASQENPAAPVAVDEVAVDEDDSEDSSDQRGKKKRDND